MKKVFENIFGILQRIGKSLMLPVALLPAAGLLIGLGKILQNQDLINKYPSILADGIINIANIMSASGDIIFINLPLIFAVGIAIGLSDNDGVAALAAIVGFFIMNITMGVYMGITPEKVANNPMYSMVLGIPTLQTGVFGGIIIGSISAVCYRKFKDIRLPQFLGFFAGKRFVAIVMAIMGLVVGLIMVIIWPVIQNLLFDFSRSMIHANVTISAFLFGVIERALVPFGLHHIWYNPFWYQFGEYINKAGQLIIGDQQIFFAQLKDGVEFTAGTFMTGKYPFMMFGLPAATLAMYHEAKEDKKKLVSGLFFSAALTSFLTGITEPVEFTFLFIAPMLFAIHCIFAGISFMIMQILNVKIGLTFSGGLIDFLLFGVIPNRTKWWLVIIVGGVFSVVYYIGFRFIIRKLDLKTPGRENDDEIIVNEEDINTDIDIGDGELAQALIDAFGGINNIKYLDACITRLRVTVKNIKNVNKDSLKRLDVAGLMIIGDNIQAILGPKSEMIKDQMKDIINGKSIKNAKKMKVLNKKIGENTGIKIAIPVSGTILNLEKVPDEIFSMKLIGDGFAINPIENILLSPISGEVISILPSNHCITIKSSDGLQIFIHIGIDTIKLNGKGFRVFVNIGDKVEIGEKLIEFPLERMREELKSSFIPIIFKNLSKEKFIYFEGDKKVYAKELNIVQIHKN